MSSNRKQPLEAGIRVAVAAVAIVVALVVGGCGGDSGGGGGVTLKEVGAVNGLLAGMPQHEMTLGDPKAPVALVEYADLQCPTCGTYAKEVLPPVIEERIAGGEEASLTFRNYVFIGPESVPAGAAALAAGEQGKGWNFVEIFYRNQGSRLTPYVSEEFIEAVGKAAGVPNLAKWNERRKSKALEDAVKKTTAEAEREGISSRGPTFTITGPDLKGVRLIGTLAGPVSMNDRLDEAISGPVRNFG